MDMYWSLDELGVFVFFCDLFCGIVVMLLVFVFYVGGSLGLICELV